MIGIVWVMLRARWARALVVCALATFTVAVAAALPAYLARADEAMISTEVSRASAAEATISARIDVPAVPAAGGSVKSASDFAVAETKLFTEPWLTTIYATDIDIDTANAAPGGSDTATIPEVVFRQGYCDHVVIVAGRCPVATREVLLDTALATRLHVGVGDSLPLHQARITVDGWVARPAYGVVSVVGTYRVPDVEDHYWGTQAYFSTAGPDRGNVLPIFAQPGTVDALPHDSERVYVDALLRPAGLAGADLATVRTRVDAMRRPGTEATVATSMPALLDRIAADRTTLRQVVPGLAVPVIVVGTFALFLAVAHAGVGRRPELAVVGLRGLASADRWWLSAGESLVAVAIAVPLGLAAGGGLARLAAAATLGGATLGGATLGGATASVASGPGPVAELAIGLVFLAVLAGCSRPAAARITDLLRRVPDRRTAWRSVPAQAAIVVLAIFTVVQLRFQPGPPTGVTLVASGLVVAGVAVLLGPLVPMLAGRIGRRAITSLARAAATPNSTVSERPPTDGRSSPGRRPKGRRPGRGRIGLGLGALAVARRPGARRLLVVAAIATGMAGFTVAVSVAAAHSRTAYVDRELGAPRVLSIGSTTPGYLLRAVRAADPSGRYAMAVMAVPQLGTNDPPLLAVDASRLAAIATPPPGVRLGAVANALQANALPANGLPANGLPANGLPANGLPANGFAPVTVTGGAVRIDVTASSTEPPIGLVASLLPTDGVAIVTADFGRLTAGRHTYKAAVDCAGGCRLVSLTVTPQADASVAMTVTVHGLASSGGIDSPASKPVAVPLATAARWRAVSAVSALDPETVSAGPAGLTLAVSAAVEAGNGITVVPVTGAYPVPVVEVGSAGPHSLSGLDATAVDVRPADRVTALPRVGDRGTLVDLDALTLAAVRPATPLPGEVWLAAGTPPAVVSALSDSGLLVASQRTAAAQRAYLSAQGPAVGVAFGLAGAGALLVLAVGCLLLVSGVERGDRTADLRALRIQGLSRHAAARSLVVSQLALVVAAAILGYAAGAAAWLLTSDHIPVLVTAGGPHLAPFTVPFAAMGVGVAAATAVLGVVALVAALASAATVATPDRWSS